uniref:Uncharacterized protein n=1 Tax=Panagrolaimus sp. JU765 TaxID=591449 RepID=A0AC34RMZ8_9BILA
MRYLIDYHKEYVRHWRILGAIWVLFTLCSAGLHILVLIHPEWIGNNRGSYFGLYNYCMSPDENDQDIYSNSCHWDVLKIRTLSNPFLISFFLVVTATVLNLLALLSILLLVLLRDRNVFIISSWMHLFSFSSLFAGCIIYPAGWDHAKVREICDSERYKLGVCHIKWAYTMALILIIDQLILAILGFILAKKKPPHIPEIQFKFGTLSRFFPQFNTQQQQPPMKPTAEAYIDPTRYLQYRSQPSRISSSIR